MVEQCGTPEKATAFLRFTGASSFSFQVDGISNTHDISDKFLPAPSKNGKMLSYRCPIDQASTEPTRTNPNRHKWLIFMLQIEA